MNGLAYFSSPRFFNDTKNCGLAIESAISDDELRDALSPDNHWLAEATPWELGKTASSANFGVDFNDGFSITYFRTIRTEFRRGRLHRVGRMLRVLADAFAKPARVGGIYCVTESWKNKKMWEEYAREWSGYVLEFDTQISPVCWDASPVEYVDEFTPVNLHASAVAGTVYQDIRRVPLTKLRNQWEGEREWRTWRSMPGLYRYPHRSLRSITFGPSMDLEIRFAILASFIGRYGFLVRFYEAKHSQGEFLRIPI
ncbi:MAG: hypothetical protein ABI142_04340 [Bryocella sp.]